jgi:hypothetical protein
MPAGGFSHGPSRPDARPGRCTPVDPRMWGRWRFGRTVAHAVRRGADVDASTRLFIMQRRVTASEHGYALPTARSLLPPSNPRSGGIAVAA